MKVLSLLVMISLSLTGCLTTQEKHYYQKPNGEWISKKKLDRIFDRALHKAFGSVSKKDLQLLTGVPINIDVSASDNKVVDSIIQSDVPVIPPNVTDTIIESKIIWVDDTIMGIPCKYGKEDDE